MITTNSNLVLLYSLYFTHGNHVHCTEPYHTFIILLYLFLNRKQFPSAPASIPSWQLGTTTVQEKATEREDDAGSGSSTNNSDSSLEIVRDDPPKD